MRVGACESVVPGAVGPGSGTGGQLPRSGTEVGRPVDIATGREVTALDQQGRLRGEYVAGAAVSGGRPPDPRPVIAPEDHGVTGPPAVCRPRQHPGPSRPGGGDRVENPGDHRLRHVGQIDEGDDDRHGGRGREGVEATAEGGAHALRPVRGDDDSGAGGLGIRDDLGVCRPHHRRDMLAPPSAQPEDRGFDEGGTVRRQPQHGLGSTHPAALPRGEDEAMDVGVHASQGATAGLCVGSLAVYAALSELP